ncbi:hypothetical protein E2542_SST08912 [Spatholobus suberectus]|nr:hypothetical protein E2542_SST08912 [Spatholobus suberectus]
MSSPLTYPVVLDDKDFDDAALWAMIDSATASHPSSKCKSLAAVKFPGRRPPSPVSKPSPPPKFRKALPDSGDSGEVVHDPWPYGQPRKVARTCPSEESSPLALVRSAQTTPPPPAAPAKAFATPEARELSCYTEVSPRCFGRSEEEKGNEVRHSLFGVFPSVSLFKEYQNAAMAILEKTDCTLISGNPFIKKSAVAGSQMDGALVSDTKRDL